MRNRFGAGWAACSMADAELSKVRLHGYLHENSPEMCGPQTLLLYSGCVVVLRQRTHWLDGKSTVCPPRVVSRVKVQQRICICTLVGLLGGVRHSVLLPHSPTENPDVTGCRLPPTVKEPAGRTRRMHPSTIDHKLAAAPYLLQRRWSVVLDMASPTIDRRTETLPTH